VAELREAIVLAHEDKLGTSIRAVSVIFESKSMRLVGRALILSFNVPKLESTNYRQLCIPGK